MTDAAVGGTAPNQWLAFRRDVTVDRLPRRAVAVIAADSKYWLWVNGRSSECRPCLHEVCRVVTDEDEVNGQMVVFEGSLKRGPNPSDAYYDTVDLAPFLQRGENKIALLLWYFGKDGFSHKGSGRPQLFFDCPALHVTTNRSWNVRIHPAFGTADCPVPNYRLSESCVAFDARNDISGCLCLPLSRLGNVQTSLHCPRCSIGWQTAAPHDFKPVDIVENTLGQLHPRPIPMWRDEGIKAVAFETRRGFLSDTLVATLPHNIQMTPVLTADVTIPWDYAEATIDGKAVTAKTLTLSPGRHEIKIKEPTTRGLPRGKDNDPPSPGGEGSGADAQAPNGRSSECRPCLHEVYRVVTDEDEVNPVSPEGVYIADPSSRVGHDGRLYVYGSLDESTDHYCSKSYHVLSTGDLRSWQLHPHTFSDEEVLYAPDAIERDGRCYLYYDHPDGSEYVAEAETPAGPFRNPTRIEGPTQIDPNIFIDDDGQAYYFWGQYSAKGARMNADMKTLDLASMKDSIVTERDHHFHEGSYVVKRGKYYYFIYADISRRQRPTCLGYAMATAPLGPYTYKGVIIDNDGCDPDTWNNHGSIVCFSGQWYVLYHRSTHGSRTMRKACIEPIHFNDDGTIDEVEMTTQGAGKPLDAYSPIDAARACRLEGHVRIRLAGDLPKREVLAETQTGDAAEWKYIDFGEGATSVTIRVQAPTGGRLTLSAGAEKTTMADHIPIPPADQWQTVKAPVTAVKGVHALRMEFSGDMNIDTVRFEK